MGKESQTLRDLLASVITGTTLNIQTSTATDLLRLVIDDSGVPVLKVSGAGSGSSGVDGSFLGTSGTSGKSGSSGISGVSGSSGISTDGTSGVSGSSGISTNGTSGVSGSSGMTPIGLSGTSTYYVSSVTGDTMLTFVDGILTSNV